MAPLSVITGTTHGIGRITALELARAGHVVAMLCRDPDAAQNVTAQILAQCPQASVHLVHCDLSDLDTVRGAAAFVRERFGPIDRLILNAGMAARSRQRTATGMDLNFAVNHLGHFLLAELLRERMAAGGRIITVASLAHYRARLDLDAVADGRERISLLASYARSKLANVLHSLALARQLEGSGVSANCLHPGIIASNLLPRWMLYALGLIRGQLFDPARGARTSLHLALTPDLGEANGIYFDENAREKAASALARDIQLQDDLWRRSLLWAGWRENGA
jgi:NAD(P)-dependent dehydrogenase (short-subunit alcohol dehydrogenase family)